MVKIIVINGYPQSGKDTFVNFCSEVYPNTFNLLTSTPAKDSLYMLGWKGEKTPEVRKALADMINLSERLFDGPFKYIQKEIQKIQETVKDPVIFVHSREPHNIDRYKSTFDASTLLISRQREGIEEYNNQADRDVWKYDYDLVIHNDGSLKLLQEKAHRFMEVTL